MNNKNCIEQLEFRCVRSTNNETPVEPFNKFRAGSPEYLPSTLWSYSKNFREKIKGQVSLFFCEDVANALFGLQK